ncbi:MAG TPA: CGNR zinc finger domain-containing protein [Actinomycetes bacterium]|jgi:predicted RNA-binding Zn ribbon-like protein|nr:CGNR zinc finger domain-containing protein [Actinomycetes bacterium]
MATAEEPIPAELQPIRDLVNTADLEDGTDRLTSSAALREWLVERDLLDPSAPVSDADLAATIELREALRAILRVNDGHPTGGRAVEVVNRAAGELPLRVRFGQDGQPFLGPRADGVRGALAAVLAGIPLARAQGTWRRLKVCSSDTCQWAFYDRSKNRSGRWCSMQECGNRTKTRAYRARRRG